MRPPGQFPLSQVVVVHTHTVYTDTPSEEECHPSSGLSVRGEGIGCKGGGPRVASQDVPELLQSALQLYTPGCMNDSYYIVRAHSRTAATNNYHWRSVTLSPPNRFLAAFIRLPQST